MNDDVFELLTEVLMIPGVNKTGFTPAGTRLWIDRRFAPALQRAGLAVVRIDCSKDAPAGDPSRLGLGPAAHWPWVDNP